VPYRTTADEELDVAGADMVMVPAASSKAVTVAPVGIPLTLFNCFPISIPLKEATLVMISDPLVVTPEVIKTPHKSLFITLTAPENPVVEDIKELAVLVVAPNVAPPLEFTYIDV
jgi:hypothetical protein